MFLTTHLSVEEPGFVPYFRFFQVVEALDTVGLAYTPKVDKKIALGLVLGILGYCVTYFWVPGRV